jgi:hypothetical protein
MASLIDTESAGMQDVYLEKRFLEQLNIELVAARLGTPAILPDNVGKTARWIFLTAATSETLTLDEGLDPASESGPTINEVDAVMDEFGSYFTYSKWYKKTAHAGMFVEFIDWSAYQGALTYDELVHTTSLADTDNTQDAGTAMTAEAIRIAVSNMHGSNVRKHPIAQASGASFCGLFSTESAFDMIGEGAPTWSQAKEENVANALQTPFGGDPTSSVLYDCIIKKDNNVQRNTATAPDDDLNYIVGRDAFGVVALAGDNAVTPEVVIITPQENVALKLKNAGSIGWNGFWATILLQDAPIREILTDATGINVTV